MLAACWALVHSTWTPAVRTIHLRWNFFSRLAAQSNHRSLLTNSRPRYPRFPPDHSVFELSSKEYATPASRTPPTSEKTLVSLVMEGNHDLANKVRQELSELGVIIQPNSVYEVVVEDMLQNESKDLWSASAFEDWMSLLPDAEDPGTNAFVRIRNLLLASPKENLPFIKQFARICAAKGYTSILKSDILPIVSRYANPAAHAAFVGELQVEAEAYQKKVASSAQPRTDEASAVFENALDEYDIVNSEATPPLPPILSVIEKTLPKVLPAPLPHDQLVFEDASNPEYSLYSTVSPSYKPISLIDNLRSLVEGQRYHEASRMLDEIRELDMVIPAHWVYLRAARAVLRSSDSPGPFSEEQINAFESWFSLIPPIHHTPASVSFVRMNELIFHSPKINVALVIRFALILASKGFALHVVQEQAVFPFIFRFAPPDIRHQFILDFEKANKEYLAGFKYMNHFRFRRLVALTRGVAVKNLLSSSRLEEAIALLPDTKSNPFPLPISTYNSLLHYLHTSNNVGMKQHIPMVHDLRRHRKTVLGRTVEYNPLGVNIPRAFETRPLEDARGRTYTFEYLKSAIASKHDCPHPETLAEFMELCFNNGKTESIEALRNIALSSDFGNASAFLFAEMFCYTRRGLHDFVIQTFVNYFLLSGVPQHEVLAQYKRGQAQTDDYGDHAYRSEHPSRFPFEWSPSIGTLPPTQSRADSCADGNEPPPKFMKFKPNPSVKKLWPVESHCLLIWHSLVRTAPDATAIERLYIKLVQLGLHRTPSTRMSTGIINPDLIPPDWKHSVRPSYFTPFIRPLMTAFGAARGRMILADMLRIGLEPHLYHYTELAGQYARTGDVVRTFKVLDQMESTIENDPAPSLPPPDVVMYTSLIAGFVISKNVRAADEVVRRFRRRYTYIPGENEDMDAVLHRLELLRKKHDLPVCFLMF